MFEPEKTVVIANPAARHGFVGDNWPALGAKIQEVLGAVTLRLTESAGHATEIAREEAIGGARTIVSFGGDGTHSEIVDGIMLSGRNQDVAFGILHAGTGGDFRKMIDGADELERGCAIIRDGEPIPIDIGWVEYVHDDGGRASRYFLNITSMGMSGLVDRYVAASQSRRSGASKYLLATIRASHAAARRKTTEVRKWSGYLSVHHCYASRCLRAGRGAIPQPEQRRRYQPRTQGPQACSRPRRRRCNASISSSRTDTSRRSIHAGAPCRTRPTPT